MSEQANLVEQDADEAPRTNAQPATVSVTGYEAKLVVSALEDRARALESSAKKDDDLGYPGEGRVKKGDAITIREHVLPKLRPVMEIPICSPAECRAGIAEAFREVVRRALWNEFQNGRSDAKIDDGDRIGEPMRVDLEQLLGDLAARVERFGVAVSDRAFAAGHAAREQTAEGLIVASLDALRPLPDGEPR